jgi:hypothetical protein
MPYPGPPDFTERKNIERRRQVRGLLLLALAVVLFSLLHAGPHRIFTPGWWRLW